MKLHLLAFTSALGGGGAEKHLLRVLNHLDRDRFRVTLALGRGGGSYERELAPDIDLRILGPTLKSSMWKLVQLMDQIRPGVVLSVMDHANCVALAAAAISRSSAPVVVGLQIPLLLEAQNNPHPTYNLLRLLVPCLYPRARAIVSLSAGVRDDLGRWLPKLKDRTRVIHNAGFDESTLAQAGDGIELPIERPPPAGPVIAACGRLTEQKGFSHLLEAFSLVRKHHPAELWLIGEGPLRGQLEAQARRLGLAEAVWFLGFRNNPYAYMKRASVFVLSSLWEGFANVVVEAMAVGTPVVATDCPHGPGEIIRSDEEGLLVPPGDPAALAGSIVRVLDSAELRRSLGRAGRQRAQDFSAGQIASQYAAVLSDVASARPSQNWFRDPGSAGTIARR